MAFKVWVEIERVDDETGDQVADAGQLGVLPDPLGIFATLEEAMQMQIEVMRAFNPSVADSSDARS